MALTAAEQRELDELESRVATPVSTLLTAAEQQELTSLEARESGQPVTAAPAAPALPEGNLLSRVTEPARAIKTGLQSQIIGGLLGISTATNPFVPKGSGERVVEAAQQFGAKRGQPKTQAGQESLQAVGSTAQSVIDTLRLPASAVGGLIELFAGQGIDQSMETINSILNEGAGETGARRFLEVVEDSDISPTLKALVATLIRVGPEAAAEFATLKGGGAALKGTEQAAVSALDTGGRAVARLPGQAVDVVKGAVDEIFQVQSPVKQKLAERIASGTTDADTALFKLKNALEDGTPRVERDTVAREAVNQGYDQGTIAAIKGASPTDKKAMLEMLDIKERGINNRLFEAKNRPGDIAGSTMLDRYRIVFDANRKAGKELDGVAKSLKGQELDASGPVEKFLRDMDDMDIAFDPKTLEPIYTDSIIEGLPGPQRIFNGIIRRMKNTRVPDAFDVHRLKRFIDQQVSFGKSAEGLTGKADNVLKDLRRNLDQTLDGKFPEYDRVNTVYSETIGGINALQDVAGKKLNLTGRNADKAVGVLLRRLMSNAQSRERLLTAAEDLEILAKRHRGTGKEIIRFGDKGKMIKLDDDVFVQTLFADELDAVFGPSGRTSFQGQIEQVAARPGAAVPTTKEGLLRSGLASIGRFRQGLKGVNQKNAFDIMRRLLKEND